MRLKGLRVTWSKTGEVEVVPLYFAKGKGTMKAKHLADVGRNLSTVLANVLAKLIARKDLKG